MTFENIGLRKLKIDADIEAIHIFNYIASKYPKLWKELTNKLEADLIYTNLVQKHKNDCLDKVRVREAIELIRKEKTKLCKRQIEKIIVDDCFNSLNNYLGIAEK
jgi:hypothetical protein